MTISEELRETLPYVIEEQVFLYLYKEKAVPVLTLTNICRCDSLSPAKHPVSFLGSWYALGFSLAAGIQPKRLE
jgi:hypothetical protein